MTPKINHLGNSTPHKTKLNDTTTHIYLNSPTHNTDTHPEEGEGRPALPRTVSNIRLLGQVLHALDGRHHPLHGEESRQVGRVGRDDDQGEEPPDASHDPGGHSPGVHVRPLLHQSAHGEPETVGQVEGVLHLVRVRVARMRVVPLVRAEARQHEDGEADEQVGPDDVQPDLHGQGVEEGEEARLLPARDLEEDGDAQVEERLGEVDHLFPLVVDGQRSCRQIRSLQDMQVIIIIIMSVFLERFSM